MNIDTFTDFITAAILFCAVWFAAIRFMDDVMGRWLRRRP